MRAKCLSLLGLLACLGQPSWSQGPLLPYFYNPATDLSWAECHIYQQGGSSRKVPFLPVVSTGIHRAPLGISDYSREVLVDGPLVFIGDGAYNEGSRDSYTGRRLEYTVGNLDVAGKVVLFSADSPDSGAEETEPTDSLAMRISEAESRGAAAVVLFSHRKDYPFLAAAFEKESDIPSIPAISITRESAVGMLLSSGLDGAEIFQQWSQSGQPPQSAELITSLRLAMRGKFDKLETDNFLLRYREEVISGEEIKEVARAHERGLAFLFDLLEEDQNLHWQKLSSVYFRGYDSKLFYTRHWGDALASDEGVFIAHTGGVPSYGLVVHELAHIFVALNWGESSSFMDEGLGKYTEAMATDQEGNHRQTREFSQQGRLYPLEKMVEFEIGMPGPETEVGYPAAGSFVAFLIETYGLDSFKKAFLLEARPLEDKKKESTWMSVYQKGLGTLESEWLGWLAAGLDDG